MARNKVLTETSEAKNNGDDYADASRAQSRDRRFTRKRAISADTDDAAKEPAVKRSRYSTRSSSAAESGSSVGQSDPLTKKSIDDLPPEVLEAVLKWISTPDVLKCREVNRKFNEIASRIMRRRADVQLYFSAADDGNFKRKVKYQHCHDQNLLVNICKPYWTSSKSKNLKKLKELIAHLKVAKTFPITSFRFDSLDKFGNADVQSFLSIWGEHILALTISIKDAASNVGVLRDLLTLPNLKKLEIEFNWRNDRSNIELFVGSKEVTLPKLQAFCVNSCYRKYPRIVAAILKAAHNLKCFSISPDERYANNIFFLDGINTSDLDMMQTLNKFHCLKELRIELSTELVDFFASKDIDLKLESLALTLVPQIWKNDQLKSAEAILNRWFHSSKDSIQTLKIWPLGSLGSDLHIPKFKNLQKLHLFGSDPYFRNDSDFKVIFPPLFEMTDQFPNLKELSVTSLHETSFVLPTSQQVKPLPSIEILRIVGILSTKCKETLLKATPNVTTLIIEEDDWDDRIMKDVSINFKLIADCLSKLQSFGWLIRRVTHHDLLYSLDAAITGLDVKFCEKFAKKFRNKENLSADELALLQLEPRKSSILDLKELKRFDINFLLDGDAYADMDIENRYDCENSDCEFGCEECTESDDEAGFSPGDILYKTGFTKVSRFLAFDIMPGLKIQTHRYLY